MSHVSSINFLTGNISAADVLAAVPTGANARMGTALLESGAATVPNTLVTPESVIMLTAQAGTVTGALRVSARTAGASFTITSSQAGDTGAVGWLILEPAD